MQSLYKDYLLDHYKYPRNAGILADANCVSQQENPSCGDLVVMTGSIMGGVMQNISFQARGCVICVASASLLSDQVKGLTLQELIAFDAQTMIALVGIPLGPTRLKCALLPLYALHDGVKRYTYNQFSQ